ncbi:hypothetical protein CLV91_1526 [Maribacter vaceletii]|uniref:Uncharacterized protein n=1 Tax=Maribacter vaceletii TaxID=1206816 RepID=A0A495E8B2_9FLAO|nr:DUF6747 family protein [Maribacter vaceletii]RKR12818.1 hypothetical protein CLV91_1525 [Maribacter vaceletii]RKR12819.1 hypothetical protein CLV91_1526 [Maribacter vaceletii]
MKRVTLVKEIYSEGFKNLGNHFVKSYFKAFAWFGFSMYAIVVFAFVFRVSTGFEFS